MEKRKLLGLVYFVSLSLAFSAMAQTVSAESPTISVSPSSVEASHGDSFTIEIKIDPKGAEIYGAQFCLYFNQNVLNATSQTQGTFLTQDGATSTVIKNEINNTLGKIEYGEVRMGAEHGVTTPGVLASITFDVIGTSGTSDLKLSNVILSDPEAVPIETTVNNGICIVTGASGTSPTSSSAPTYTDITAEEAYQMFEEDPAQITFLDVRTEDEYNAEHIPEAKLIPLPELESRIDELDANKKIIVYCQTGERSRTASEILVQHGFESVYNMLGGIDAWRLLFPDALIKPAPTPEVTPSPVLSPSHAVSPSPAVSVTPSPVLSPSHAVSPSPAASPIASPTSTPTPTPPPEQKWKIPGFEVVLAIAGLLLTSYFILIKRRGSNKK